MTASTLQQMFDEALRELYANAQEDWVEDGKYFFTDLGKAPEQVEKVNDMLAELGGQVPEPLKGKQFLVYGHQLKLLPVERIPSAKALAATFVSC